MARSARRAGRQPAAECERRARVGVAAALLGVAMVVVGLPLAGVAGAAETPDVVPDVECSFLDSGTGQYNTVWGYKNQTKGEKNDLPIPVGPANRFDNPAANAGQPTVFKPGEDKNVFIVTHSGQSTWTLTSYTATAPGSACSTNPVPIASATGWAPLVTLAIVTAVVSGIVFWRARRAARARRP